MSEDINIELAKDSMFENKVEVDIKEEEYIIRYNNDANPVMINAYLLKMVEDTDKIIKVMKNNEFYIENRTAVKKKIALEEALSKKV